MNEGNTNEIFDNHYTSMDDIEIVILKLKEIGLSQMETTKALIDKLKISLKEADGFVVNSKAWRDNYDSLVEFRNRLFDSADEMIKTDSTD
jgi:hypothetical protein